MDRNLKDVLKDGNSAADPQDPLPQGVGRSIDWIVWLKGI